jgi:hypothetical protein
MNRCAFVGISITFVHLINALNMEHDTEAEEPAEIVDLICFGQAKQPLSGER